MYPATLALREACPAAIWSVAMAWNNRGRYGDRVSQPPFSQVAISFAFERFTVPA